MPVRGRSYFAARRRSPTRFPGRAGRLPRRHLFGSLIAVLVIAPAVGAGAVYLGLKQPAEDGRSLHGVAIEFRGAEVITPPAERLLIQRMRIPVAPRRIRATEAKTLVPGNGGTASPAQPEETGPEETPPEQTPAVIAEGDATWYHRDGMVAAHPSLPFGTAVTVTNLSNGRSVTVAIDDRGPFGGAIIDLSDDAFQQLAPLSSGRIAVRIGW